MTPLGSSVMICVAYRVVRTAVVEMIVCVVMIRIKVCLLLCVCVRDGEREGKVNAQN